MARRRRSAEPEDERARFVDVASRKFAQFDVDLVEESPDDVLARCKGFALAATSAVVKLRVRYNRGDEEQANHVAAELQKAVGKTAHHVYRPELVAVGDRITRVPELDEQVEPMDAVRMWLKARPPKVHDVESVEAELEAYLREVGDQAGRGRLQIGLPPVRSIVLENFMPFEACEVDDVPDGVTGVVAVYDGEEGRSNRAGKSALLEAVVFALYGKARDVNTLDEYVRRGADVMSVEVHFDGWWVRRSRTASGQGTLEIDGARWKVAEGEAEIVKRVGCGREDFLRICFVGQGDLHGILGETSAEISQRIVGWLGVEVWYKVSGLVKADLGKRTAELDTATHRQGDEQRRVEENEVPDAELSVAEAAVHEAEEAAKNAVDPEEAVRDLEKRLRTARRVWEAMKVAGTRQKWDHQVQSLQEDLNAARESVGEARTELGSRKAEADKCRRTARGQFTGKCPEDGGKCPRTDEINGNRDVVRKRLEKLEKEVGVVIAAVGDAQAVADGMQGKLDEARGKLRDATAADKVLAEEGKDAEDVAGLERSLAAARANVETGTGHQDLQVAVVRTRNALADLMAKRKVHDAAQDKVIKLVEEIKRLKNEVSMLRYLSVVVGRQGIPAMIVENALATLEGQANEVLSRMGTEHRLRFGFEAELKKKAVECPECGRPFEKGERKCSCGAERGNAKAERLEVRVEDGGREQSFDMDSGGGKALLSLAVRVALARMFGASMMSLDETDGPLDRENLRRLLTTLRELPTLGIDQVFVVSHRQEVAESIGRNIVVRRDAGEGRSMAAWDNE